MGRLAQLVLKTIHSFEVTERSSKLFDLAGMRLGEGIAQYLELLLGG